LEKSLFGLKNKILAGLDFYRYDYSYDTYSASDILQDFSDINKISLGGYVQDEFSILENLILLGGYRYESARYEFDYHDNSGTFPDLDNNIRPNKKAFNFGLRYKPGLPFSGNR
jgi:outer membrane receptor protein involved in Fe transport